MSVSAMRWFRKNTKKLMVGIVIVLMIAFVIPSVFFGNRNQQQENQLLATYVDSQGRQQQITNSDFARASRDLAILKALNFDNMQLLQVMLQNLPDLADVQPLPSFLVRQLLFPDNYTGRMLRDNLYQMTQRLDHLDPQARQALQESIERISDVDQAESIHCYLLLRQEAQQAGIHATEKQVTAVINFRLMPEIIKALGPVSIQRIREQYGMSEQAFEAAVADYVAILRYGSIATKALTASEPQIKSALRDSLQRDSIMGSFVSFRATMFGKDLPEPSEEEIVALFETYKQFLPGEPAEENPYGLGYMLPDRVQVEYLKVDHAQATKVVLKEFGQKSPSEQQQIIERFWADNQNLFREEIPKPAGVQDDPAAQPEYRDPEFDEVAEKARQMWEQQQARVTAEQVINQAKQLARKQAAPSDDDNPELHRSNADYATLAQQLKTDSLDLAYGKSDYLSGADAQAFLDFANTYKIRKNDQPLALLNILFDCEPLHTGRVSRLDEPPVQLYEDLGPLLAVRRNGPAIASYLVRIVAVDPARQPLSLDDDGREGPASAPIPEKAESHLRTRVKADWLNLKKYELAQAKAREFARLAPSDWDQTWKQFNSELKVDPNQPFDPLRLETLDNTRTRMKQYLEYASSNPEPYLISQINQMQQLLQDAMELARHPQADDEPALPILEKPQQFSLLVFKDLQATAPSQQEYLDLKVPVAMQLVNREQQVMSLTLLDPQKIETRNQYKALEEIQE